MATKKKRVARRTVTDTFTKSQHAGPKEQPIVLTKEALDDLRYIEPKRAHDRIVSMFNELYGFVLNLREQHRPREH